MKKLTLRTFRNSSFTLLAFLLSLSNVTPQSADVECHTPHDPLPPGILSNGNNCAHIGQYNSTFDEDYIPSETDQIKTVRVILHVMQKSDGSDNFQENDPDHMAYLNGIFGPLDGTGGNPPSVNKVYSTLQEPIYSGSPTGDPYIEDSRIRTELIDIFFHQDDLGWSNNGYSGGGNSEDHRYCFDNYAVSTCNALNVFIIGRYEPDYEPIAGAGPGWFGLHTNFVLMYNMYPDYVNNPPGIHGTNHKGGLPWIVNPLIAHEIGHCFGLHHTFNFSTCNQFPDLDCPQYQHWCSPSSDFQCSNNVMSYSSTKRHLTPLQLGHVNEQLSGTWRKLMLVDTYDSDFDVVISGNDTWNFAKTLRGHLTIESGSKLTIKCEVSMPQGGRIIVEPNAELIIDGGRITNYSKCEGSFWQGIELWGTTGAPQAKVSGYRAQGYLQLKNGGIIENAVIGVTNYKPGDDEFVGGVIDARDGEFINNQIAVNFDKYQNIQPGSGNPLPNISKFKGTKFIINDDYLGDFETEGPEAQVKLYGVDGVSFTGCEFINTSTVSESVQRSRGIFSEDAHYRVQPACASIQSVGTPCPSADVIPTVFDGFFRGIEANMAEDPLPILVNAAVFKNNMVGIELASLAFSEIIKSEFEIGGHPHESHPQSGEYQDHLGIYSNLTRCFVIEENDFYKSPNANWDEVTGVLVYQSEENSNNVYLNDFNGLKQGAIGYQVNRDADGIIGLQFQCNGMTGNHHDFVVSRIAGSGHTTSGIRTFQGNLNPTLAAGNSFSVPNGVTNEFTHWDINSQPNYHYYHSPGQGPDPDEITPNKIFPTQFQNENTCLTNYVHSGHKPVSGKGGVIQEYNQKKSDYYNLLYIYKQLTDDGDTEGTLDEIIASWPADAWDLYDMLMARSPNNSDTVLIAAADREIMPHAMLLEVLLANPDALRNGQVINHVENRLNNPMPSYMIDILHAASDQSTLRTTIQSTLSDHHAEMSRNYNFIIQLYSTDTLNGVYNDSLLYYLEQMDSPTGKYNLAGRLMRVGEYSTALNIIDSIPVNYKLTSSQNNEWKAMQAFFNLLDDAYRDSRNIAALDSTEIVELQSIALDADGGMGALRARKALCFFYQNCISGPALPRNMSAGNKKPLPPLDELLSELDKVSAFPNPAKDYITFSYSFFREQAPTRQLRVFNQNGALIQTFDLGKAQEGQQLWDTRGTTPGIYLYDVYEGKRKVHAGKIVIQ